QRAASIGRGGETVLSAAVAEVIGHAPGVRFVELAPKRLKGLPARQRLFVVADAAAPLRQTAAAGFRSWPRARWLALIGTFVFAAVALFGVSVANSPEKPTLINPAGIAVDSSGRAYVVSGNEIISVYQGVISRYAGTGVKGFVGDGGPARNAQLSDPTAV